MKEKQVIKVKPCPFCNGEVRATHGLIQAPIFFFKCKNCGAVVSFNNNECNTHCERAIDYFNNRA